MLALGNVLEKAGERRTLSYVAGSVGAVIVASIIGYLALRPKQVDSVIEANGQVRGTEVKR